MDDNKLTNDNGFDISSIVNVKSSIPKRRQDRLRWDGWGYKDCGFEVTKETVVFHGNHYAIACDVPLDALVKYLKDKYDYTLEDNIKDFYKKPTKFPEPIVCEKFIQEIQNKQIDYSDLGEDRLIRSHGQSMTDIYSIKTGNIGRIPDIVLWPKNHDEVMSIVAMADKYNVVILPFGGGTSVSNAITCPQNEKRPIAALDTSQMNRMLWLDKSNLVACFESGIVGQDLERVLNGEGFTMGHEPDSLEFSTLGGWVATRASGMKKNHYGNIEDMIIRVKMVTAKGVLERNTLAPRISAGPDFNHLVLGSEGTLGVITEVVVKVHQQPEVRKYDSIIFPDFESGFYFLREVASKQCQPASIRLVDNEHFEMAQILKSSNTWASAIKEKAKRFFLTTIKGFDLTKLAVVTVLYEGGKDRVAEQQRTINQIVQKYSGYVVGASYGEDGYKLTFVVSYIRDLGLDFGIFGESFETSVPWDRCLGVFSAVENCITRECKKRSIVYYSMAHRISQVYDTGACIYFYWGYRCDSQQNAIEIFHEIHNLVRHEVLASGGSISHHHGVGKHRSFWYEQTVSKLGVQLLKSAKHELDPKNIFAIGNLISEKSENDELTAKL